MEIFSTIKNVMDKIPTLVETLRTLLVNVSEKFSLPTDIHLFFFLILAGYLGYLFLKQFVVYSIFTKLSSFINWLLISLLIYLCLAYL